jgi:hypothetical protein
MQDRILSELGIDIMTELETKFGPICNNSAIWTGNSSTDWSSPDNWDRLYIPDIGTEVTIPTTPTGGNFPETNSQSEGVCKKVTVQTGAQITVPLGKTLKIINNNN